LLCRSWIEETLTADAPAAWQPLHVPRAMVRQSFADRPGADFQYQFRFPPAADKFAGAQSVHPGVVQRIRAFESAYLPGWPDPPWAGNEA